MEDESFFSKNIDSDFNRGMLKLLVGCCDLNQNDEVIYYEQKFRPITPEDAVDEETVDFVTEKIISDVWGKNLIEVQTETPLDIEPSWIAKAELLGLIRDWVGRNYKLDDFLVPVGDPITHTKLYGDICLEAKDELFMALCPPT
jgi:hypothetical protein